MSTHQTISNVQFRRKLGQISDQIASTNQDAIITKSGRPSIAVLSISRYQQLTRLQDELRGNIELIPWNELPADELAAVKQARLDYADGQSVSLDEYLAQSQED